MTLIKQLFAIYIYGSMHVAASVLALVLMTNHMFGLPFDAPVAVFAFCGTMFSYNFMKYDGLFRVKRTAGPRVKLIVALSTLALIAAGISFLYLERVSQVASLLFFGLTALYTVPFFPNTRNLRNWSGVKIYIVALCWAGITTIVPLLNAGMGLTSDAYLKFSQRFLLVIILILIFEIIDLREDDPHLKTIPQQIGVRNSKVLNLLLLVPFYFLEFFKSVVDVRQLLVNIMLVIAVALFTIFANPNRPKYYTLFWVEAVPIFWLGLVVLVSQIACKS